MSPKRSNIQDGLNRSSSGSRLSLEHPLDNRYLLASPVDDGEHFHMNESQSEGLPGAFVIGTRTSRVRQNQQAIDIDRHCQETTAPMSDDVAALVSENQDLRQQTMELKLQLADAMAKIDELEQQNRQLMHMHNMQDGHTSTEKVVPDQTYREYNQDMKPAADTNNHSDQKPRNTALQSFDRSLGYVQGNSRPSSYLSKPGGPLQALGGVASVRNMFSSLRGEAEVTDASSALATSESKRSSIFSTRSSFYSARSMSSVSTSIRNDDSSQSISLNPDDLALAKYGGDNSIPSIGHHNSGSALESTPEESADGTKQCEKVTLDSTATSASWLQKLSSLPGLNRGESAGSAHLEDDGDDAQAKHLHRMSRRGSNSAPNLQSLAPDASGTPADPTQERQKLAESISQSTLRQFHGSTLDFMALAPSKLAEVTREDKVAGSALVDSVERAADQTYGIRRKCQDIHGNDRRSGNPNKPLNARDQFEIPLKTKKTKAKANPAEEEDAGMKRKNTDKDVNDFFRRMSGAISDDESDAEDLAGGGNNEDWDDLADKAKKLSSISKDDVKNDFAAIADKLIADSTFDLYK